VIGISYRLLPFGVLKMWINRLIFACICDFFVVSLWGGYIKKNNDTKKGEKKIKKSLCNPKKGCILVL
jgi:hypothetical protein